MYRGRKNKVLVGLNRNVSDSTFSSEIRVDKDPESELLATWDVNFVTDGNDGELVLTLPTSATEEITKSGGFMDMKEVVSGDTAEPLSVFGEPLEVIFKNVVTA